MFYLTYKQDNNSGNSYTKTYQMFNTASNSFYDISFRMGFEGNIILSINRRFIDNWNTSKFIIIQLYSNYNHINNLSQNIRKIKKDIKLQCPIPYLKEENLKETQFLRVVDRMLKEVDFNLQFKKFIIKNGL